MSNRHASQSRWQSADVRFRTKLFGSGTAGRWKSPPTRATLPPPDLSIEFILNWGDVVDETSDMETLSTTDVLNPDLL